MELFMEWMRSAGQALFHMLTQPFYYLAILFVLLQYRRQIFLERKLYHVKLHSLLAGSLKAVGLGLAAGAAASAAMAGLGSRVQAETIFWLWGIAFALMLIRVRFLCFAYSAGILGLLHAAAALWHDWTERGQTGWDPSAQGGWLEAAYRSLLEVHMPSVFVLVALMHLIEAALVRIDGARMAMPLFLKGKRGKLVGGYQIQGFWPVPLLLLVPASSAPGAAGGPGLPWTPLFGAGEEGWGLIAFPLLIGFSELTMSMTPERKARRSAAGLAGFSVLLLAAAFVAQWSVWLIVLASVISVVMHEGMLLASRLMEKSAAPFFAHSDKGLKVLGVLPGSPAAQLGILPGETIHRVNGERVRTRAELHRAMRRNPAFIKLELLDLRGENRFLQRAVYDGEHHQLGIILAPDEQALYYMEYVQRPIFGYIWMALSGLLRSGAAPSGDRGAVPTGESGAGPSVRGGESTTGESAVAAGGNAISSGGRELPS
jgi:hypothetical protein